MKIAQQAYSTLIKNQTEMKSLEIKLSNKKYLSIYFCMTYGEFAGQKLS